MTGTPREVFSRTEELTNAGLSVPHVTRVMDQLSRAGLPVGTGIYTVSDAVDALLPLMKGGANNA